MMKRAGRMFACLVLTLCLFGLSAGAAVDVTDSIVKIYTINNEPDYYNPWSMRGPRGVTGSGCIIKGRRILTNGHIVGNQTFIQVRRHGEAKKFQARVLSVSHDADLALLTVDDPAFFAGSEPLEIGELPLSQQEVLVYGFPLGGDVLSTTKGVISRIEHRPYAHSSSYLLAGQIDAAINPGNSGGPVMVDGRIVGVVMQSMSGADNIGYMVPVPIIEHFLADIEDGKYDGYPSLGLIMQSMENPDLKKKYKVPDELTGMLIVDPVPTSPAAGDILPGDVLLEVDGHPVADDGTVEFRPKERTSVAHWIQVHQIGEPLDVKLLRDGEPMSLRVHLTRPLTADRMVAMEEYDVLPTYYVYGGVVFVPVTKNLLIAWGNNWFNVAPKNLVALLADNFVEDDRNEMVMVLKVLAADVNEGYHGQANWLVESVNGERIRNLRHLIEIVEGDSSQSFVTFKNERGEEIVLDREKVAKADAEILKTYRIPADRSPDLK